MRNSTGFTMGKHFSEMINQILGPNGSIASCVGNFEFRPSQLQYAELVYKALREKHYAIIEAGTGTGKTLGYLVPVLLSDKKTVISTATKNLQEQIFLKDIPLLEKATGEQVNALMMKGRKNYLCLHRYFQNFSRPFLPGIELGKTRERFEEWLEKTEFADRSELSWMREDDPIWNLLSASSEQCLGTECPSWDDCYLNRLRRKAAQARIIVVNHHLLFADLVVKEGGFGEIIPRFQALVFDEAHALEDIATTYFGESLSTNQLMELVSDIEREKTLRREKELMGHLEAIKTAGAELRQIFEQGEEKGELSKNYIEIIAKGPAHAIKRALGFICHSSRFREMKNPFLQSLAIRAADLENRLDRLLTSNDPNWLKWYEKRKKAVVLHMSPLDISGSMDRLLYQKVKSIVFTSATLSAGRTFDYFRTRMGLSSTSLQQIYPSHFDFGKQSLMYVPTDLPDPNDQLFVQKAAERIAELLKISKGRALVLFTSHHNMNTVSQLLEGKIPFPAYRQGEAPRSSLLSRFREQTHSVLFATGSFWQGVDVPGEALSCLIIDKLPFDSPADPLVGARIRLIRERGGNPFMDYQLPSAILALKQGLGRLIRSSSDRGIISVLDVRIRTSRYGRFFLDSLPVIPLTHNLDDIARFFES
ncbi:MAG: ATP-dependent DNA helicase [Deltaproteobacteria bacterium]|nr:ATP-dependent DNA helicase [Deltaproteobacteria bacterium]